MPDWLHHPAFQSLLAPAGLAALGMGVASLRGAAVRLRAPALAVPLALLLALALLPGYHWPAGSASDKLAWVGIAAAAVAMTGRLAGRQRTGAPHPADLSAVPLVAALVAWTGTCLWLAAGGAMPWTLLAAGVLQLALLAPAAAVATADEVPTSARAATVVDRPGAADAERAAVLATAMFGLAALLALAGSLLLAQIAAIGGAVWLGIAPWLWPRARAAVPVALCLGSAVLWLALVQAGLQGTALAPGAALLCGLAPLALGPWRRRAGDGWGRPLLTLALALLPVIAALAWQQFGTVLDPSTSAPADDPYYTPSR